MRPKSWCRQLHSNIHFKHKKTKTQQLTTTWKYNLHLNNLTRDYELTITMELLHKCLCLSVEQHTTGYVPDA